MIGLLLVTDVRFYREGLAELLGRTPALRVIATAANGEDALAAVHRESPDIVLIDAAMPNAIAIALALAAGAPHVKVMALALRESDDDILAWAEAGAASYVPPDRSLAELVQAVESTSRGELLCPPRIAASMLRRIGALAGRAPNTAPAASPDAELTQREREIALLVEQGLSNKEIARRLGIEVATAKTHIHHILEKLHLRRRIEIAARRGRSSS
jgi:two-component system, NarL family, nitrate/nitrite response regulator NarL